MSRSSNVVIRILCFESSFAKTKNMDPQETPIRECFQSATNLTLEAGMESVSGEIIKPCQRQQRASRSRGGVEGGGGAGAERRRSERSPPPSPQLACVARRNPARGAPARPFHSFWALCLGTVTFSDCTGARRLQSPPAPGLSPGRQRRRHHRPRPALQPASSFRPASAPALCLARSRSARPSSPG